MEKVAPNYNIHYPKNLQSVKYEIGNFLRMKKKTCAFQRSHNRTTDHRRSGFDCLTYRNHDEMPNTSLHLDRSNTVNTVMSILDRTNTVMSIMYETVNCMRLRAV